MTIPMDTGPEPVKITVYQNDDSVIEFYPFGDDVAELPADFADYDYVIDVWQSLDSATLLLTSGGGLPDFETERDDAAGLITFKLPRATALAFEIVADMRYDCREVDPDGKNTTLLAGVFEVTVRGAVT